MDCESILCYVARVCEEESAREDGKRHARTLESPDGK